METENANTFYLNEWQDEFIFNTRKYSTLFNEFGSGKSTAAIIKVHNLLEQYSKNRVVIIRNLIDDLDNGTIPQYFELIFGSRYNVPDDHYWNSTKRLLRLPNDSELRFMALDRPESVKKLKNITIGAFFIDQGEEIAEDIWNMLEGRLRLDDVPLYGFMTGNPEGGDHWIKTKFYNRKIDVTKEKIDNENVEYGYYQGRDSNYYGIVAKPLSNANNLPSGYYENLKKSYDREWLLKYVYSMWTGKTGLIYPFDDDNIVYESYPFNLLSLPKYSIVAYGQDYGISDTSPMVWLTIVKTEECYYIVDEYYEYEKGIDDVCDYVKSLNAIIAQDTEFTLGCPRTFAREASERRNTISKRPLELFENNGIEISKYPVLFEARQPVLAKLIEDNCLKIFEKCKNTIREFKSFKWRNFKTASVHSIEPIERVIHKFENYIEFDQKVLNNLPAGL